MEQQAGGKRTTIWALVIGGLGVVVAIVALVIALSANTATNDTAKITKAVRAEQSSQIGGVARISRRTWPQRPLSSPGCSEAPRALTGPIPS